jgi:hypothetical protein
MAAQPSSEDGAQQAQQAQQALSFGDSLQPPRMEQMAAASNTALQGRSFMQTWALPFQPGALISAQFSLLLTLLGSLGHQDMPSRGAQLPLKKPNAEPSAGVLNMPTQ